MPKITETTNESLWERCGDTTQRDRRNLKHVLWITIVWAVTFLGTTWIVKKELLPTGPISWAMAALPTVAGLLVCVIYTRYLRQADELQRTNQLRALALGFGAGWLALSGYPLFERLGAPAFDAGDYTLVMAVFFSIGILLGSWRYR